MGMRVAMMQFLLFSGMRREESLARTSAVVLRRNRDVHWNVQTTEPKTQQSAGHWARTNSAEQIELYHRPGDRATLLHRLGYDHCTGLAGLGRSSRSARLSRPNVGGWIDNRVRAVRVRPSSAQNAFTRRQETFATANAGCRRVIVVNSPVILSLVTSSSVTPSLRISSDSIARPYATAAPSSMTLSAR